MKKTLNYVLLLMLAMMAINLQSCKDDDDNNNVKQNNSSSVDLSSAIIGSWVTTSYTRGDSTFKVPQPTYMKIDSTNIFYITYLDIEGIEGWRINRQPYIIKNGNVFEPYSTEWSATFDKDNNMTIKGVNSDSASTLLSRTELPAVVDSMIANGDYNDPFIEDFGN